MEDKSKPVIDLSNSQGGVFVLIGLVYRHAKHLNRDAKIITDEMMEGDYRNAVNIFKQELGQYYDVILPEGMSFGTIMKTRKDNSKMKLYNIKDEEPTIVEDIFMR